MAEIKLFVCCHQPTQVPAYPLLVPIQVGTALADIHFPGFLHDDTGDNISERNRSYCELTAHYWAWKNAKAEYYGFFHYRRYLYPDPKAKQPYRIEGKPTLSLLKKLGYEEFESRIRQYDVILPKGENMFIPVREHYAMAPFHHREDLELVEQIVRERHPEMAEAAEQYLAGTVCYFGNIFIMRRQVFENYCSWIFPILEEFDRRADTDGYSIQERRVDGYLAERLLGIWWTYTRSRLRGLELPRVHMVGSFRERMLKQAQWVVVPPGTRRRAWLKGLRTHLFM